MPHWTLRFVVGVLVSAFCTLILLVNVGAMAGGMIVLNVAGDHAFFTSYYVAGGGLFVSVLIVIMWRRKVREGPPAAQTSSRRRAAALLVRPVVIWLLLAVWCTVGGTIIRSQVKLFRVDGDSQLLDRKVVETEWAVGGFRLYRLGPSGGSEYTLVVKKHLVDEVRRTFEAEGAAVHPIGW